MREAKRKQYVCECIRSPVNRGKRTLTADARAHRFGPTEANWRFTSTAGLRFADGGPRDGAADPAGTASLSLHDRLPRGEHVPAEHPRDREAVQDQVDQDGLRSASRV